MQSLSRLKEEKGLRAGVPEHGLLKGSKKKKKGSLINTKIGVSSDETFVQQTNKNIGTYWHKPGTRPLAKLFLDNQLYIKQMNLMSYSLIGIMYCDSFHNLTINNFLN